MRTAKSQTISIVLHLIVIGLLLLLSARIRTLHLPTRYPGHRIRLIAPRRIVIKRASIGGGGNTTESPPRRGSLPVRAPRTFILPVSFVNPAPQLPVQSTIALDIPVPQIQSTELGDPYGKAVGVGLGSGGVGGIGTGCCGAYGDGRGPSSGSANLDGSLKPPVLIYRVEPEFSEEARHAKFQGTVLLRIEVGVDGRPRNFRVIESPGLGLDQKAIAAVEQWRFRPASRSGKPVASTAVIEVHFQLL